MDPFHEAAVGEVDSWFDGAYVQAPPPLPPQKKPNTNLRPWVLALTALFLLVQVAALSSSYLHVHHSQSISKPDSESYSSDDRTEISFGPFGRFSSETSESGTTCLGDDCAAAQNGQTPQQVQGAYDKNDRRNLRPGHVSR